MNKKIALILAPIMVAMLIGTSYALWSKTITMSGTVSTGNVDVDWSLEAWGVDEEKKVSTIDAVISADGDTLTITIGNAYPCVWYWVDFDIHCSGSIPVHLLNFVIDRGNLPDDATLTIDDLSGVQLHQCESAYGTLELHLGNDAVQNGVYRFSATIQANQYNE